ncbi:hypothetical protein CH063_00574 [Colletotrichum higginsianum]|uniref:Protein kinase n=1 Tax=Colletotrichum higginsianum (strain IMI 349063) TaxID=759273 RepID=H1VZR8_COLHI|nr:Protein kinase [Colletotrichum higginsianum IMI 349063]OBR16373.1 Protein kinase [Colletotrichum higginsianum IMI 349063]CCF45730.1 hypothetical protein CH063_00574 [Colletotrichum higginsianum]
MAQEADAKDDESNTLHIVLLRRTTKTVSECPSQIHHVPVSQATFKQITESFHTHRALARIITRKDTEFLYCLQVNDSFEPERLVYNYRTSATWPNDVAVSVTHDPKFRSTTAIFFGLDDSQEHTLMERMKDSLDDFYHPLALVGAVCELERDRLVTEHARPMEGRYLEKNLEWSSGSSESLASGSETETMEDVLGLRFDSSFLLTGLTAARRQLSRIVEHIEKLRNDDEMAVFMRGARCWASKEIKTGSGDADRSRQLRHTAERLQQRLNQISDEFEMKLDSVRTSMEDMMATTQVVISRIARHDNQINMAISVATRRDNSQMRSIAFVTMFYLPLTSIATIFSMNVFNWDAKDGENLMTTHFWLYLAVAGVSTVLTLGLWVFYTGMRTRLFSKKKDEEAAEAGSPTT